MHKIEYELKVDEDDGALYIGLPDDYDNKPEDKFFVILLARYVLINTLNNAHHKLDEHTISTINTSLSLLEQIGNEMGDLLFESMKNLGEVDLMLMKQYHIKVKTKSELENIGNKYILFNNRIFEKEDGLKAFVENENKIYVLNNNDWIEND